MRKIRALLAGALLTVCMTLVTATAASAHTVWWITNFTSSHICMKGLSTINHGDNGGGATQIYMFVYFPNCSDPWTLPTGSLLMKDDYLVYDLNNQTWGLCFTSGWLTNPGPYQAMTYRWDFGTGAPCGTAWYATLGSFYVWANNRWYGGTVASGNHWLPDYGPNLASLEQPPAPSWIRADGTVDSAKLPSRLPVIGRDGNQRLDRKGAPMYADIRPALPPGPATNAKPGLPVTRPPAIG